MNGLQHDFYPPIQLYLDICPYLDFAFYLPEFFFTIFTILEVATPLCPKGEKWGPKVSVRIETSQSIPNYSYSHMEWCDVVNTSWEISKSFFIHFQYI